MDGLSVAVVGGGSGFGRVMAQMAVERGASGLGIIDINGKAIEECLAGLQSAKLQVASAVCDIRTSEAACSGFEKISESLGRVDTLINSAAIYPRKSILEITDADWDAANAVNVKGTYHMCVAAIRHFLEQTEVDAIRGRIVNITSVDAFKAHPQNAHYAATKAAVASLTRSLAHEVASSNILVNSVAPAGMATEKAREAGFLNELAAASPLGRSASPREMAEWVMMAGGRKNTYMTGENIIVSGGYIYA